MLALRVVCARGGHGSPQRWGQWLHETTAVLFFGLLTFCSFREFRDADNARRAQPPPQASRACRVHVLSFIHGVANELSLSIEAPEHPV
jgi:hypothetical protein